MKLPEGYVFLDKTSAAKLMGRLGNKPDDGTVGIIARDEASWLLSLHREVRKEIGADLARCSGKELIKGD